MCECMIVTQTLMGSPSPGTTLRVTTASAAVVITTGAYAGTYLPLGYVRKDWPADDNMAIGTTEVDGIIDAQYLTDFDLQIGLWDGAEWIKFKCDYTDPDDWQVLLANGTLGIVRTGRLRFTAELLSMMQVVQNGIGALNSPLCIHKFGASEGGPGRGNGCTVNLAPFTFTGTVDSVDSDLYGIHDSARTEADSYFSNGIFRVTSGVLDGFEYEIRAYIQGFWVLIVPLPVDVTGETYEIVRGCNKTLRQCVDDFDNILDRLASDYTQGNDAAIQVARHN